MSGRPVRAAVDRAVPRKVRQRLPTVDRALGGVLDVAGELGTERLVAKGNEVEKARGHATRGGDAVELDALPGGTAVGFDKVGLEVHGGEVVGFARTLSNRECFRKGYVTAPIIPHGNPAPDHGGMDNKLVRRRNIEALVSKAGGPTEFGRQIEREQVPVSQWLGGKNIGDKLARHVEAKLGKPVGWLDTPQWEYDEGLTTSSRSGSQPGRLDPSTIADAMKLLRFLDELLPKPAPAELFPQRLAIAYEVVEAEGASVTDSNIVHIAKFLAARLRSLETSDGDKRDEVA